MEPEGEGQGASTWGQDAVKAVSNETRASPWPQPAGLCDPFQMAQMTALDCPGSQILDHGRRKATACWSVWEGGVPLCDVWFV